MTGYLRRELAGLARRALRSLPVVVITGLRQVGKSTFLQRDPSLRGRRYLSLDDLDVLEAARRDPEAFIRHREPVTIDEVQRCPELLLAIKRAVDADRTPGRFVLSGSANLALLKDVTESLAGRAGYYVLHPLSHRERRRLTGKAPFLKRFIETPRITTEEEIPPLDTSEVLDGGLPPVALDDQVDRQIWFEGYEKTYLERDVRDLARLPDLMSFRNFLRLTAHRTGQVLNISNLARDAHCSSHVASNYLSLLEASFVVRRLPPELRSPVSRLIKSPKLFMEDSGLAAHLMQARAAGGMIDPLLFGPLLETYVAQNLASILQLHLPGATLGFWHVQGRHEVDFVISDARRSIGIEVKADTRVRPEHLASLEAFLANTPSAITGILAYNGRRVLPMGDRLFAVPHFLLLS